MGTECSCNNITGTRGEAITATRSTVAECVSGNGQLVTQCPINKPRVTRGLATETQLGIFIESGAANWITGSSRDMSNAAYTKSNMTCVRNAIGMRGDANGATTCTATGANATVCQTVNHTLITGQPTAVACGSYFIKRSVGVGAASVAYDGASYTAITSDLSTSSWKRVAKATTVAGDKLIAVSSMCSTTATDPVICVKLATSGDAVELDFWQVETNDFNTGSVSAATAPIEVPGSTAVRSADLYSAAKPALMSNAVGCMGWTALWGVKAISGPQISMGSTAGYAAYLDTPTQFYLYDGTNNPGPSNPVITVNVPFSVKGTWSTALNALTGTTSGGGALSSAYDNTIIGTGDTVYFGTRNNGGSFTNRLNGVMRNILIDNTTTGCDWTSTVSDGGWTEYVDWEWPGTTTTMIPIITDFTARVLTDGGTPIGATNIYDSYPAYDGGVIVEDAGLYFVRGRDAGPNIWTNIPYLANGFPGASSGIKYEVCFSPAWSSSQWLDGQEPNWDGTIYLADFNTESAHTVTFIFGSGVAENLYVRIQGSNPETFDIRGISWTAGRNYCVSAESVPIPSSALCTNAIKFDDCGSTPVPSCTATTLVGFDDGGVGDGGFWGVCPNTASYLTLGQRQFGFDPTNLAPTTVHISSVRAWAP
jgi:hypothetical protein